MRITPVTDDDPYFNVFRKHWGVTEADPQNFITAPMTQIVNQQLRFHDHVPLDLIHLVAVGVVSIVFMCLFVFVPLRFSAVGRQEEGKAAPLLVYFSCLGLAFITIELTFIQKFMQLVGSPLYTYSTVIFALLCSSGLGSLASAKIAPQGTARWRIPFTAIIVLLVAFVLMQSTLFRIGLSFDLPGRILFASLVIFPIGFFLGMPFPLGVLSIEGRSRGAVAWAWGMNGAFTILGGVSSVVLSIAYGFTVTLLTSTVVYLIAAFAYPRLSAARDAHVRVPVAGGETPA